MKKNVDITKNTKVKIKDTLLAFGLSKYDKIQDNIKSKTGAIIIPIQAIIIVPIESIHQI